jgi:hypothetical protein
METYRNRRGWVRWVHRKVFTAEYAGGAERWRLTATAGVGYAGFTVKFLPQRAQGAQRVDLPMLCGVDAKDRNYPDIIQ